MTGRKVGTPLGLFRSRDLKWPGVIGRVKAAADFMNHIVACSVTALPLLDAEQI